MRYTVQVTSTINFWDIVTMLQSCVPKYKNNKKYINDYTNLLKAAIANTSLCDVGNELLALNEFTQWIRTE